MEQTNTLYESVGKNDRFVESIGLLHFSFLGLGEDNAEQQETASEQKNEETAVEHGYVF